MLTFDAEHHVYTLDGKVLPSITQIIRPLVNYDAVPKAVLENAANFGRNVHKMVELECCGALDEEALDDKLRPALAAFRGWRRQNSGDVICEIPMAHARLKFAGTPDLIFDGHSIIEIKTRKTNLLTDPIQTAAQEMLWLANYGAKGDYQHGVLELYADGRHHFQPFTTKQKREAANRFRYLLDYHVMSTNIKTWGPL